MRHIPGAHRACAAPAAAAAAPHQTARGSLATRARRHPPEQTKAHCAVAAALPVGVGHTDGPRGPGRQQRRADSTARAGQRRRPEPALARQARVPAGDEPPRVRARPRRPRRAPCSEPGRATSNLQENSKNYLSQNLLLSGGAMTGHITGVTTISGATDFFWNNINH